MASERAPERLADGTVYYGRIGEIAYDPEEDKVQCHLCGGWFRCVGGPHLAYKHRWTADEYREAFHLPRTMPTIAPGASEQRRITTSRAVADGRIPVFDSRVAAVRAVAGVRQSVPRWRSIAALRPQLAAEFHPTRNGDLDLHTLALSSRERVWWRCGQCGHEWQTEARTRAGRGTGCPRCTTRERAEGMRDRPRVGSIAGRRPDLVAQLHPSRNGNPQAAAALPICSQRVLWWRCERCAYEWQARPVDRRRTTPPAPCPACSRREIARQLRVVAAERSLAVREPALAAQLHPTRNGPLHAASLGAGSNQRVWWRCEACGHEWQARIKSRVHARAGCPSCHTKPG